MYVLNLDHTKADKKTQEWVKRLKLKFSFDVSATKNIGSTVDLMLETVTSCLEKNDERSVQQRKNDPIENALLTSPTAEFMGAEPTATSEVTL